MMPSVFQAAVTYIHTCNIFLISVHWCDVINDHLFVCWFTFVSSRVIWLVVGEQASVESVIDGNRRCRRRKTSGRKQSGWLAAPSGVFKRDIHAISSIPFYTNAHTYVHIHSFTHQLYRKWKIETGSDVDNPLVNDVAMAGWVVGWLVVAAVVAAFATFTLSTDIATKHLFLLGSFSKDLMTRLDATRRDKTRNPYPSPFVRPTLTQLDFG